MRCIFIVSRRTISPNGRGGASTIHYEQLNALSALGHELHLWHYAYPNQREEFECFMQNEPEIWQEIESKCKSITISTLPAKPSFINRVSNKIANVLSADDVMNPLLRAVAFPLLKQMIVRVQPDVIWSQHFGATQVAALQPHVPVIYSHHDWLYRIKRGHLNGKGTHNGRDRLREAEEKVATKVEAVVSGSAVECEQLRRIGCKNVAYIPVAYEPVFLEPSVKAGPWARLVHLGGMGTTANRIGLERFFEVAWPDLATTAELWIVGDTRECSTELAKSLAKVKCTGYVKDLTTVLRPFDLHIIPWEHNTGQRTRMVMAFNYAQVVVAVRDAVAGFPEAVDGQNCRLVDRLDQMSGAIQKLIDNPAERERLGKAARATFENHFTRESLLPRFKAVISTLS